MNNLIITTDLDGTLFLTYQKMQKRFYQKFGKKLSDSVLQKQNFYTLLPNETEWCLAYFQKPDAYSNLLVDNEGIKIIKELYQQGHYICFLTSRPIQFYDLTYKTLAQLLDFSYIELRFCSRDGKLEILQHWKTDIMIEDEFAIAKKIAEAKIHTILIEREWNKKYYYDSPFFNRCRSWVEVALVVRHISKGGEK